MIKLSELTKEQMEILKKSENFAVCPYCKNIVGKDDNYCGCCGNKLDRKASDKTDVSN